MTAKSKTGNLVRPLLGTSRDKPRHLKPLLLYVSSRKFLACGMVAMLLAKKLGLLGLRCHAWLSMRGFAMLAVG